MPRIPNIAAWKWGSTGTCFLPCCTARVFLWWRRRPLGTLGAPQNATTATPTPALFAVIALLGVLLPLSGLSLIAVAATERLALRRLAGPRAWLGLGGTTEGWAQSPGLSSFSSY